MKKTAHHMKNNWVTTTTADSTLEMMSLFDYLGHPAGGELGKQVAKVASKCNVVASVRHVSTKTYKGPVMLYPKGFLNWYFEDETNDTALFKHDDNKLPF
jgi:hypothetical protein